MQRIQQATAQMSNLLGGMLELSRLREEPQTAAEEPLPFVYTSGPLGDLKVSRSYFMPVMMGNADAAFMTYEVKTPVSVKRGQSAMVPILDAPLTFQALCVFNGDKLPNHPLLVWRLQNTTNLALEQGPVTLIHQGRYLGEGLLRFSGAGDDIQIAYALEFGILVEETTAWGDKTVFQVRFDAETRKGVVNRAQVTTYRYHLTSRVSRDITVHIERRDPSRGAYFEMSAPALALAGHSRWPVVVPANQAAEFAVQVREVQADSEDVNTWSAEFIEDLRSAGLLPDDRHTQLQNLLTEKRSTAEANEEIKTLQSEYAQITTLQEQLRKNLSALGDSERETTIRNRILDDLETSEDRRREIEARIAGLNAQIRQRQQNQQAALDQLFSAG
jgi:hypothetical protein